MEGRALNEIGSRQDSKPGGLSKLTASPNSIATAIKPSACDCLERFLEARRSARQVLHPVFKTVI